MPKFMKVNNNLPQLISEGPAACSAPAFFRHASFSRFANPN